MQIKTTKRYHFTLIRIAIIKKSTINKCWRGYGEKGPLLYCSRECKLVLPFYWWKSHSLLFPPPFSLTFHPYQALLLPSKYISQNSLLSISPEFPRFSSVQFRCSVVSDSLQPHGLKVVPGLPVHHQLPVFTQTYVHWVGDAIQPSHPLSSPSPPAFNLCQHQCFFQWVSSSQQVSKVLEFQLQQQSFKWIFRADFL